MDAGQSLGLGQRKSRHNCGFAHKSSMKPTSASVILLDVALRQLLSVHGLEREWEGDEDARDGGVSSDSSMVRVGECSRVAPRWRGSSSGVCGAFVLDSFCGVSGEWAPGIAVDGCWPASDRVRGGWT